MSGRTANRPPGSQVLDAVAGELRRYHPDGVSAWDCVTLGRTRLREERTVASVIDTGFG